MRGILPTLTYIINYLRIHPYYRGKTNKIAQDRVLILEARELLRVRDESLQGFEESLRNGIKVYLEVKERNSDQSKG